MTAKEQRSFPLRTGFGGGVGRSVGGVEGWETGGERKEEEEKMRTNENINLISQRRCRWWHRIRKESGNSEGQLTNVSISTFPICLYFFSLLSVTSTLVAFLLLHVYHSLSIHIFQLATVLFQM